MAAPAVAVVGALAATPQVRSLVTSTPAAATNAATADRIADPAQAAVAAVGSTAKSSAYWAQHAKPAGARSQASAAAASRAAAARRAAARKARAAAAASPAPSPSPSTSSPTTPPSTGGSSSGTPSCTGPVNGPVPENFAAIVDFLVDHGYSDNAAAGIAGNIYQESGGNPESGGDGGGGLIGWTPLPAGMITGNVSADLQTQLEGILTFNDNLSEFLPALNDASSPAAAADVYVTDFERAGIPAAGTREEAAEAVATACNI